MVLSDPSPPRRHDNHVIAGLPETELRMLARRLEVVSFPPGVILQPQDFAADHVYFPHQGVMSLLAMTPSGETIETASAGRGGALCSILSSEPNDVLLASVGPGPMFASRIVAAHLRAALAESDALSRAMCACREALLLQLRQNLLCSGLHSIEQRLSRWVLEMADRLESRVVPATQELVAQRLGVRRTTVTLLASKLQHVGAINWGRSRVDVLERGRLEAMACSCYATLRGHLSTVLPAASGFSAKGLAS